MTQSDNSSLTKDWIKAHLEPRSELAIKQKALTYFCALDMVYRDYYKFMQNSHTTTLTKQDFVEAVKATLLNTRLGTRRFPKRTFKYRTKTWVDEEVPEWILDGCRYYKDKIGGELRFGV